MLRMKELGVANKQNPFMQECFFLFDNSAPAHTMVLERGSLLLLIYGP